VGRRRGTGPEGLRRIGRQPLSVVHNPQDFDAVVTSTPVLLRINGDDTSDVVVAAQNGKLYALDGNRGFLIWKSKETSGKFFSTPLVTDVNKDRTADLIIGSPDRRVYGIDGATGQKIWETAVDGAVDSSPVLLNPAVAVVADESGTLYELSVTAGSILARTSLEAAVISSPAVLNRDDAPRIVAAMKNGAILAFSAPDLKPLWRYESRYQDPFVASPAVCDLNRDRCEDIVITSRSGYCHLISGRDGRDLAEPVFTGNSLSSSPALADVNHDRFLDIVFGSENGHVLASP